ncbi:MAG: hypothetical protein IVW51_11340 [Thermaceae bacterium]|nr:hypothetical protein [Thermaceae bacterium]
MSLERLQQQVDLALEVYRGCQQLEQREYGPQYDEVKRMEDEAPAPDPCTETFNELLEACMRYVSSGGDRDVLELGEYRQAVYSRLEDMERWENEGGQS